MESIKNRERKSNRFTLCFKSVDMKDGGGGGTKVYADNRRVSDNNATDDNNDSRIFPVTPSGLSDEGVKVSVSASDEVVVVGKMKKRTKLSRIVKAVFFETSLARKIRGKKSRKKSLRSSINISTNSDKDSNSTDDKSSPRVSSSDEDKEDNNNNNNQRTYSSFSSSVTSGTTTTLGLSNSSSMASSTTRSMPERKASSFQSKSMDMKQQREENGWKYYGLCLLLVSLLVLILWGKVCAIFCTSACLFFVPRRSSIGHGSSGIGVGLPEEVETVEYKKKVIMEGLLGRNRARVL